MSGTLYIIGTPIGNLEDITMRQLRLLGEVDFLAAEDTRVTRKLLSHYDIHTPIVSYHEHSGLTVAQSIAGRIRITTQSVYTLVPHGDSYAGLCCTAVYAGSETSLVFEFFYKQMPGTPGGVESS